MTNIKKFFEGNFLKAEDCKGGELCEITGPGVTDEIEGANGEVKEVRNYPVKVNGVEKTFSPNKTNGNIMMQAWGEDDDAWIGKKFQIELIKISAFGKVRNSIVVKPIVEQKPKR